MVKFTVLFTLMLLALYVATLGSQTYTLLTSQNAVGVTMGAVLILIPALGIWGVFVEVKFGFAAEKLAKLAQQEGRWPNLDYETTPAGKPIKASALKVFDRIKEESQQAETDWHSWFNLALAYDACGDRSRARASMRKAIAMAKNS